MRPETRNTHVRGPLASMHARKLPEPVSFRFVTRIVVPPRPPSDPAPPPCAPGNARTVSSEFVSGPSLLSLRLPPPSSPPPPSPLPSPLLLAPQLAEISPQPSQA